MSFAEWIFLLGGFAVIGPLIAHLLAKPRYRRLPFTMLRFLRTGQVESQSRRKLRDVLILLLRCAIIVLIAMLFAQPMLHIRGKLEKARSVYYLGLDNSMSMAYSDGPGSYFSELVDSAIDYIRSADDEGIFNICTLGSGDWASGLSKERALVQLKRLKVAPVSTNIDEFLSGLRTTRDGRHSRDITSVFVLSDFTPNTLKQFIDIEKPAIVDNINYKPIASRKPINNAAIVDARVNGLANGKLTINATVVNRGRIEQNRQLTAKIGANKSAPVDISVSANQRRTYQVQIDIDAAGQPPYLLAKTERGLPVQLSLSAGDGLKEDDTFYLGLSLPQRKNVNVLLSDNGTGEMFLLRTAMKTLSRMNSYETLNIKQVLIGDLTLSDLDWANIMVCSAITDRLGYIAVDLKNFVKGGGKIVFFMTDEPSSEAAKQLWEQEVLAALPQRCVRERTYIEPGPCDNRFSPFLLSPAPASPGARRGGGQESRGVEDKSGGRPLRILVGDKSGGIDSVAAKSLSNYRMDRIVLTGFLECEQHPDSSCLWRLQNGFGFVYFKRIGKGAAILVNTSVDDSLGSLTKSNASIAFCRYLLGQNNQIGEYCFARDERVMLPAYDVEVPFAGRKQFWVETCNGRNRRAALVESFLSVPDPAGIGWVKTLTKPIRYAGVNLPKGETDMTKPIAAEVAKIMDRIFSPDERQNAAAVQVSGKKRYKPLWKMFAWIIILLLLVEPAVANRLKR